MIEAKNGPNGHAQYDLTRVVDNEWSREYNDRELKVSRLIEDYILLTKNMDEDGELTRKYTGTSGVCKLGYFFKKYYPSFMASAANTGAARRKFDAESKEEDLGGRVDGLIDEVKKRWKARYEGGADWSPLTPWS